MYKDALFFVAKLAFKTHYKYPILFSAAILAATYAILYKTAPRAPATPPPRRRRPSVDCFEEAANENLQFECESLASEPSINSHLNDEVVSSTPVYPSPSPPSSTSTDSSWIDDSSEHDIEMARRAAN